MSKQYSRPAELSDLIDWLQVPQAKRRRRLLLMFIPTAIIVVILSVFIGIWEFIQDLWKAIVRGFLGAKEPIGEFWEDFADSYNIRDES